MKIDKFLKSFYYAGRGIAVGFKERNMRFHGLAAFLVVVLGVILGLSEWEWITIFLLIALVWASELINTTIEDLSNLIRDSQKLDYQATRSARDMAAGAVLVISISAAIIGLLIFVPKIFGL